MKVCSRKEVAMGTRTHAPAIGTSIVDSIAQSVSSRGLVLPVLSSDEMKSRNNPGRDFDLNQFVADQTAIHEYFLKTGERPKF